MVKIKKANETIQQIVPQITALEQKTEKPDEKIDSNKPVMQNNITKEEPQKVELHKEEKFDVSKINFSFNLKDAKYEIDALQNKLLEFYIRADIRFRRAFNMNYTNDFIQYMRDKARLREPIHLSVMGTTRGGKSYTSISFCILHQAFYNRKFSIDYICANSMEFLEKLRTMPENKLKDRVFLIDEEKTAVFGWGSTSKKLRLTDVANIVAINNISTISLNPIKFANQEASYGIRIFGKCYKTKTCRMMIYNLQESKNTNLPLGMMYFPIFTALIPKDYADEIEKPYMEKKIAWVGLEMRGNSDTLAVLRKNLAGNFMRDKKYLAIKGKDAKISYISYKLGSEWTTGEIKDIFELTKLMQQGAIPINEEEK